MKTAKYNLGSEWCPGSQNWFHLIVDESGNWRVEIEKDYDNPNKEGYSMPLAPSDFPKHKVHDIPLSEVLAKKISELGLNPN